MATANCTLTYVRTMDKGTNETSATYHFGYGNGGQRWVTCYKVTVPSYTGTPSSITFNFSVNRGTAYTVNRNSTWKIGLDEQAPVWSSADGAYTAGSVYAKGYYYTYGSLTNSFSGSITSSTSSFSSTFTTTSSAYVDSGSTFYVYFYSGADTYNSIKLLSVSAYITYTTEAVTGTTLVVGTTSSPSSTYAYPTPSKRTVYYKVAGLANPVSSYAYFRVYLSSGFSFTNGNTYSSTSSMGTLVATYTNSSSSAYEFTSSFTIPNSNFYIGKSTGIVVVASTTAYPNRYWRIGGSDNTPKTCYIYPKATDWFQDAISVTPKVTGKNSVTYTVTHKTKNNPRYLFWVGVTPENLSTSGSNSYSSGKLQVATSSSTGYGAFLPTTSSSATYTMTYSNLSAGTTYNLYGVAGAKSESPYYANSSYYGLGSIAPFTTDANYSVTSSVSVTSSSTAYISFEVSSTINLDGKLYYSTSSGLSSKPSTYASMEDTDSGAFNLSNLSAGTSYTYYFYVYSSASENLYQAGSTTFTTDAASYSVEVSGVSTTSTDADIYITSISPTTNLIANRVYLSSVPSSDSYYFYYNCTNHGLLMSYSENGNPLVYEAILPTSDVKYLQFESLKAPNEEIRMYPDNSNDVVSAGDFQIYDDIPDDAEIGEWQLSFATAFGEDPSHIDFEQYYVSPGNGSVNLELEPAHEYTKYIYVKSSASNQYYLGGIIVFKTGSYFYHCEDTSALTPCWAFMYNESEESWERALPDFSNL